MLTDGITEAWNGVSGVAEQVARQGGGLVPTLLLALLVFVVGAAAGFLARLLWPHSR